MFNKMNEMPDSRLPYICSACGAAGALCSFMIHDFKLTLMFCWLGLGNFALGQVLDALHKKNTKRKS